MDCWVYHKTEEPKIVSNEEAKKLYKLDWADTPAAFVDLSEVVDMSNEIEVDMVGHVMDEMKQLANDAIAVKTMRGKGLASLAEKYEVDSEGLSVPELREAVAEAINGNGE